ncbi:MAG: hypothetical protein MK052_03490, partial [Alphaproteobacteria bacterium]|nr:hypothetical protein [Alphaproteobacteria bacterium]
PSIIDMLRDTGPSSDTMVGNTHITVVSDGDLGDTEQSKVVLSKFLKTCPNASLDFAIINYKKVTDMEIMAKGLEQRHGNSVSVATNKEQECPGTNSTTGDAQRMKLSKLTNRIQQSIVAPAIPQGVKMTHYDRFTTAFSVERGGLEVNER